jgi:beta-barrel assembly-enhancing protease
MRFSTAAILSVILAASLAGADKKKDDPGQIGHREVGKCLNFYSIQKEMALGKQLAEEVQRQAKVDSDPLLSEFVNRLGQNLARNSDATVPFVFRVIDDDAPNAFALPGGHVFVDTGLIKLASEEDELAGAIAHEIAHVAARHFTCRATKGEIANILTAPLGSVLGGWGGVAARQGAGLGLPAMFMKLSRSDESEADYLGLQYMYAAGYDPNGTISILEKLDALRRRQPGLMARVYSTHPMDSTRIENAQKEIQRILSAKPEYVVSTSEYHDLRERLLDRDGQGDSGRDGRPRLRVNTGAGKSGPQEDPEGRPTIRRRDLIH